MDCKPLFSSRLIDSNIVHNVPNDFVLRPLEATDYDKGYLNVLSKLTDVGEIDQTRFLQRLNYFRAHSHEYYLIVIEHVSLRKIVGCGTMFLERKFIHNVGCVGHLEDVVTLPEYRGMQFGIMIIQALTSVSKNLGAYKTILDCLDKNVAFYKAKCGFTVCGNEMHVRHPENETKKTLAPKL